MFNQLKKKLIFLCVISTVLLISNQVWAISLSFTPSASEIGIGESLSIDLVISDMQNDDLGYFEFDVNYDDSILEFDSYTLGSGLGDIALGDADDWSFGDLGAGTINLIELSYLSDLSFQADFFTLATLSFTSLAAGTSPVSFSNIVLSDAYGGALSADLMSSSVDASASVPEPTTLLLFGTGIAAFGVIRGKRKKHSKT